MFMTFMPCLTCWKVPRAMFWLTAIIGHRACGTNWLHINSICVHRFVLHAEKHTPGPIGSPTCGLALKLSLVNWLTVSTSSVFGREMLGISVLDGCVKCLVMPLRSEEHTSE